MKTTQKGSILVGLLWCLALLSVVVIGVLHTSRLELIVVKNYGDRIQAHYLAVAGIERAKALLYRDARDRSRSGVNHSGNLYDSPSDFRAVKYGRGTFTVLRRARPDEGGGVLYGVSDEESRLNINNISLEQLGQIDGMTPDIAAAIVDWRDPDHEITPGGAEAEYYTSLTPPRLPRDGPFQTVRELLMVRGMSSQMLFGDDRHANGMLPVQQEGAEDSGANADFGWGELLTTDSAVDDVSATGETRVNIQEADENTLAGVRGFTPQIAHSIVVYRGQNRLQSIADLLDVPAAQNNNQPGQANQPNNANQNQTGTPNQQNNDPNAPKVISTDLLMEVADGVTVQSGGTLAGIVNINTASRDVLICLPGVTRQLADGIISYRRSTGFFPNIAYLLRVEGMTTDIFKQVAPLISARSETFRILCEGRVPSSGARQRLQEIVHLGLHSVSTVSYREDDL